MAPPPPHQHHRTSTTAPAAAAAASCSNIIYIPRAAARRCCTRMLLGAATAKTGGRINSNLCKLWRCPPPPPAVARYGGGRGHLAASHHHCYQPIRDAPGHHRQHCCGYQHNTTRTGKTFPSLEKCYKEQTKILCWGGREKKLCFVQNLMNHQGLLILKS